MQSNGKTLRPVLKVTDCIMGWCHICLIFAGELSEWVETFSSHLFESWSDLGVWGMKNYIQKLKMENMAFH